MPERIARLKAIAEELERELKALGPVDEQSRHVLAGALEELRTALGETDTASLKSEPLIARFRAAEEDFQVSHPTLAGLVLRMIDALGQLGI